MRVLLRCASAHVRAPSANEMSRRHCASPSPASWQRLVAALFESHWRGVLLLSAPSVAQRRRRTARPRVAIWLTRVASRGRGLQLARSLRGEPLSLVAQTYDSFSFQATTAAAGDRHCCACEERCATQNLVTPLGAKQNSIANSRRSRTGARFWPRAPPSSSPPPASLDQIFELGDD